MTILDKPAHNALQVLNDLPITWAVCGGWGIDIYLNQKTRDHKDLDITVKRSDQLLIQSFLLAQGWQLLKVESGELSDWLVGEFLELPIHNVWCSHPDYPEHYLEVLFSEADDTHYKFRRKLSIRLPLEDAFLTSSRHIPILAPEIILLFKAKYSDTNADYQQDFEQCYPQLSTSQQMWLKQSILDVYGQHQWTTR